MAIIPENCLGCSLSKEGEPWSLQKVPVSLPKSGEVLVKVICCGFCHTDLDTQAGELGPMVKWPTTPGHEIVGDVVAVGPGSDQWSVGDRVGGAWHGGHDGTCRQCREASFQGCENHVINGVSKLGGFSEYCILNSNAVVKVPAEMDPVQVAPLLCAGVTLFNSMRHQGVKPGETVVIQGLGGLGHLGIQYARHMGYRVVAVSSSESKRSDAISLGADQFINTKTSDTVSELKKLGGAKMVIITAPNPDIMGQYVESLVWQGKLLILVPIDGIQVNGSTLVNKSCSVTGWHAGHAKDCEEAIAFARLHDISAVVEKFPFADIAGAAKHISSGKAKYRVVLVMQ